MEDKIIEKKIQDTEKYIEMVSKHKKWEITSDKELLGYLSEGLTINWNRYGYFSCPCRLAKGKRDLDRDIICPCDYAPADINQYGHCYCGLYQSKEFSFSGKEFGSIPERRNK